MSGVTHIPNEVGLRKALGGWEPDPGTAVAPTFVLPGTYTSNDNTPHEAQPEATGFLMKRRTPKRGATAYDTSYTDNLSFEWLARYMRLGMEAGDVATLVGGSTGAYRRVQSPVVDRFGHDHMSVEHFVDGLGFKDRGVTFPVWNISGDVDDADANWKFDASPSIRAQGELPGSFEGVWTSATTTTGTMTGAGWTVDEHAGKYINLGVNNTAPIRQIVSNTATTVTWGAPVDVAPAVGEQFRIEGKFTSGVAPVGRTLIPTHGTKLFIDPVTRAIGTTRVLKRFIRFNVSYELVNTSKFFMDNAPGEIERLSPEEIRVTFQVRLEFDRRDELLQMQRLDHFRLRIEQEGPEIDSGVNNLARLDIPEAFWSQATKDERGSNLTVTMAGEALLPLSGSGFDVETINGWATT